MRLGIPGAMILATGADSDEIDRLRHNEAAAIYEKDIVHQEFERLLEVNIQLREDLKKASPPDIIVPTVVVPGTDVYKAIYAFLDAAHAPGVVLARMNIRDERYRLCSRVDWDTLVWPNIQTYLRSYEAEFLDCDDFALDQQAECRHRFKLTGVAVCETPSMPGPVGPDDPATQGHYFNLVLFSDAGVLSCALFEPQTRGYPGLRDSFAGMTRPYALDLGYGCEVRV